jgi:hypothetical protein
MMSWPTRKMKRKNRKNKPTRSILIFDNVPPSGGTFLSEILEYFTKRRALDALPDYLLPFTFYRLLIT